MVTKPDRTKVMEAFYRMPAEMRAAVSLRLLEGESKSDVAKCLGMSEDHAEVLFQAGMMEIANAMGIRERSGPLWFVLRDTLRQVHDDEFPPGLLDRIRAAAERWFSAPQAGSQG